MSKYFCDRLNDWLTSIRCYDRYTHILRHYINQYILKCVDAKRHRNRDVKKSQPLISGKVFYCRKQNLYDFILDPNRLVFKQLSNTAKKRNENKNKHCCVRTSK